MNRFFKLFGLKFRIEIWRDNDDEIVIISDTMPDEHTNFWEELTKKESK